MINFLKKHTTSCCEDILACPMSHNWSLGRHVMQGVMHWSFLGQKNSKWILYTEHEKPKS